MMNDLEKTANDFFNTPQGSKFADKKDSISKIVDSDDGQKIKNILNEQDLSSALKAGNMDALKSVLNSVLKTDEGARIYKQLNDIMK